MNLNLDNDQLYNICSGLFKGFIDWIEVNSQNEKALILDSAYQFKNQILSQDNPTLQKKYFQEGQTLIFQDLKCLIGYFSRKQFCQLLENRN